MNNSVLKNTVLDKSSNPFRQSIVPLMIGLCAFFIIYKYILQVFPSIMGTVLMREFQMNGLNSGHLSAAFLDALVITQVFVGYWLDRYKVTRLIVGAILLCSLGALLFSFAYTMPVAIVARVLMGMGGAFAAASYFKIVSLLVPPQYFAFVNGLLATAVTIGIILGQVPLAWCISKIHWRYVLWSLSAFGVCLAIVFSFFADRVLDHAAYMPTSSESHEVDRLTVYAILCNPQNWLLTIYHGLAFSPIGIFAGLWGISFLTQSCQIDSTSAAWLSACIFVGFGIGSPVIGYCADRYNQNKPFMVWSGILVLLFVSILLYYPHLPLVWVGSLLFMTGFSSGALMLGFTLGKYLNSFGAAATVITLLNTGGVAITALTEPLIGYLLDWGWQGQWVEGVRYFGLEDYQRALSIVPIYLIGALILLYFIQDIGAHQQHNTHSTE